MGTFQSNAVLLHKKSHCERKPLPISGTYRDWMIMVNSGLICYWRLHGNLENIHFKQHVSNTRQETLEMHPFPDSLPLLKPISRKPGYQDNGSIIRSTDYLPLFALHSRCARTAVEISTVLWLVYWELWLTKFSIVI